MTQQARGKTFLVWNGQAYLEPEATPAPVLAPSSFVKRSSSRAAWPELIRLLVICYLLPFAVLLLVAHFFGSNGVSVAGAKSAPRFPQWRPK